MQHERHAGLQDMSVGQLDAQVVNPRGRIADTDAVAAVTGSSVDAVDEIYPVHRLGDIGRRHTGPGDLQTGLKRFSENAVQALQSGHRPRDSAGNTPRSRGSPGREP